MYNTDQALIQSFFYICRQTRRGYVRISQERMLEILRTHYQIDICRRTLNYHLRTLEDNLFICRIRRHCRGNDGKIKFHTSINILKKKAIQVIAKFARYLKAVRWVFRSDPERNVLFDREKFQKEMIESYRLSINSS